MTSHSKPQRVAVITGASSGLGLAAAKSLAAQGWKIIGTGRDAERTATALAALQSAVAPGVPVHMLRVDLALVAEAARAAGEIAKLTDRIDVLINNAGGTSNGRHITAEGNEATFAGNHLGHFVMTRRLLPLLRAAARAAPPGATRIVNVSSKGHEGAPGLDWNDLQMIEKFVPMRAYCNVKLANVLFTRELASRVQTDGIVVHAIHPGVIASNFASYGDAGLQQFFRERTDKLTPEQAAEALVWLATAREPGTTTSQYYYQCQTIPTSEKANDLEAARRLWAESEKLEAKVLG